MLSPQERRARNARRQYKNQAHIDAAVNRLSNSRGISVASARRLVMREYRALISLGEMFIRPDGEVVIYRDENVWLQITEADIAQGVRRGRSNCIVALALRRSRLGRQYFGPADVGNANVNVRGRLCRHITVKFRMSNKLRRAIKEFDQGAAWGLGERDVAFVPYPNEQRAGKIPTPAPRPADAPPPRPRVLLPTRTIQLHRAA